MALRLMLVSLFLLATAACSAYHKELDGNPPFTSHHYRYYDLDVVWQSERTDEGIRVTGKVTNRRDYYLRDLELTSGFSIARGLFSPRILQQIFLHTFHQGRPNRFAWSSAYLPGQLRNGSDSRMSTGLPKNLRDSGDTMKSRISETSTPLCE